MASKKRLIDKDALIELCDAPHWCVWKSEIEDFPAVDAIAVDEIKAYLQARLDEWNALGDRKWEPANMWGYNFIMACFDDLERRAEHGK